jgi:predicted acetyltransferase
MIELKIEKLIEEAILDQKKIVMIDKNNYQEYFPLYKKIYEAQFKTKINERDFKKWLDSSKMIIIPNSPSSGAFARCKHIFKNDKYNEFFGIKESVFLSDMAALPAHKGYGKTLLNYIIKKAISKKLPIITVPWKDSLIPYYEGFGFKTYHPKEKKLPNVVMIRK